MTLELSAIDVPGTAGPWEASSAVFCAALKARVPCDAIVVGLYHNRTPQCDETLLCDGLGMDTIQRWCAANLEHSAAFRAARKRGFGSDGAEDGGDAGTDKFGHVMVHVLPESLSESRAWWFIMARQRQAFTPHEAKVAALLLRKWMIAFHQADATHTGRLILGHDDRLIHADVSLQFLLLSHPQVLPELLAAFHPVIKQRWETPDDGRMRDIAVQLAGRPYWVRFHGRSVSCSNVTAAGMPPAASTSGASAATSNVSAARNWRLEIHPLETNEIPVVGVVEDDRIGLALGFIHDRFEESPSLAGIAQAVHISPFHFHRLFSRYVGISPKHYLQRKQLQVARYLLRATRTPIGDVAKMAGFSSHGHFTSTFHRLIGASPSEYREKA